MNDGTCSTPGCDKPARAREMCSAHYEQWRQSTNPGRRSPALPCSVDGCDSPVKALNWCNMHYRRWRKHGEPGDAARLTVNGLDPRTRFDLYTNRDAPDGHWLWTGTQDDDGYGVFHVGGRMVFAYRWAYEHFVDPIPAGMQIDHVCRVHACVNALDIRHLEVVTPRENYLRGISPPAINARKTHCPQGHPYDEANTWYSKDGWRQCRACWAIKDAQRKHDRRAAS